jgi:FPC/CPF motif-containing protein YcgG
VRRKVKKTTEDFLIDLENRGFKFQEDAIGFIYFGKKYTDASDELVNSAIEITLKAQKQFDSSFYMSILERLHSQKITSRKEALKWMVHQGLS